MLKILKGIYINRRMYFKFIFNRICLLLREGFFFLIKVENEFFFFFMIFKNKLDNSIILI